MKMLKRAFTLTEVLVAIVIIGILASIMIPVVASVRDSMGVTKCQSNLRQIYLAVTLFTNDNKGYLPGGPGKPLTTVVPPYHGASAPLHTLGVYISPYMDIKFPPGTQLVNSYMRCPAGPELPMDSTANNKRSYLLVSGPGGVFPMGNYDNKPAASMPVNMNVYTSLYPAPILPMVMDTDAEYLPHLASANMIYAAPVHRKGRNGVFFDGSVRLLSKPEWDANRALLNKMK